MNCFVSGFLLAQHLKPIDFAASSFLCQNVGKMLALFLTPHYRQTKRLRMPSCLATSILSMIAV